MGVRGEDGSHRRGREVRGGPGSPGPLSAAFHTNLGEGQMAIRRHYWQESPAPPLLPSLVLLHSKRASIAKGKDRRLRARAAPSPHPCSQPATRPRGAWKLYSSAPFFSHHEREEHMLPCDTRGGVGGVPGPQFSILRASSAGAELRSGDETRGARGLSAFRGPLPPELCSSPSPTSKRLQTEPTARAAHTEAAPSPAQSVHRPFPEQGW